MGTPGDEPPPRRHVLQLLVRSSDPSSAGLVGECPTLQLAGVPAPVPPRSSRNSTQVFRGDRGAARALRFRRGVLVARVWQGERGVGVVLRARSARAGLLRHVRERGDPRLKFEISPQDDGGHAGLDELRARGINLVATRSPVERSRSEFLHPAAAELAFYVGCLTCTPELGRLGIRPRFRPHAKPQPNPLRLGLYDVVLALTMPTRAWPTT